LGGARAARPTMPTGEMVGLAALEPPYIFVIGVARPIAPIVPSPFFRAR
jgi:hypothetical protein